eukprot:7378252-Prymnesium_polylepis.1
MTITRFLSLGISPSDCCTGVSGAGAVATADIGMSATAAATTTDVNVRSSVKQVVSRRLLSKAMALPGVTGTRASCGRNQCHSVLPAGSRPVGF